MKVSRWFTERLRASYLLDLAPLKDVRASKKSADEMHILTFTNGDPDRMRRFSEPQKD
jgi:hypothetical protein